MKNKRFKTANPNIQWEDTGYVKVYNYPPMRNSHSYIVRIYNQYDRNNEFEVKQVEGQPIYFDSLSEEHLALAISIANAQNVLSKRLKRDEGLTEL